MMGMGFPALPSWNSYYSPFLSMATPSSTVLHSPFVDLPDANPVVARQHMFTTQQHPQMAASSSLSSAAAAAAAGSRADQQQQRGEEMLHPLAHIFQIDSDPRQLHFLLSTAGIPPPGESMPIGATQRDIEKFSTTVLWSTTGDEDVDPCTVCMSEFEAGENVRILPCSHNFHVPCIDRWLAYNKRCPNCRVDVDHQAAASAPAASAAEGAATTAEVAVESAAAAAATTNQQQAFLQQLQQLIHPTPRVHLARPASAAAAQQVIHNIASVASSMPALANIPLD